jgi:hypothetical protein
LNKLKLVTWNFGRLAGTCALAFTIHTTVTPVIKNNLIQAKNLRDLKLGYLFGFLIYAAIGILGCLPIICNYAYNSAMNCTDTILNCYISSTPLVLVV